MDREHDDEFYSVRQAACDGLRSGRSVDDAGRSLLRFVVLPTFGNIVAWDVRSLRVTGKRMETRLFRSRWRMNLDGHAFSSPLKRLKYSRPYRPTIEVGSAPLDAAKIKKLIRRLRAITLPLFVAEPLFGCDGTTYELVIGDFSCHSKIVWWERLPDEWKAIGPVLEDMVTLFESTFCYARIKVRDLETGRPM